MSTPYPIALDHISPGWVHCPNCGAEDQPDSQPHTCDVCHTEYWLPASMLTKLMPRKVPTEEDKLVLDALAHYAATCPHQEDDMIESQLEKLVLDALAHFADTCPYCERELDQAVTLAELRKWLGEQECRT